MDFLKLSIEKKNRARGVGKSKKSSPKERKKETKKQKIYNQGCCVLMTCCGSSEKVPDTEFDGLRNGLQVIEKEKGKKSRLQKTGRQAFAF